MTPLWTAADAAAATGGRVAGDWQASGVSIDTRTLERGDLFVALSASRDGHDFVADALAKGAAAALVSRVPDGVDPARLLLVPEVLQGLGALGMAARARTNARVVAITGSVGKTGSKEMLRVALNGQARLHVAEKSYNNHEGVPLTLARMPADTEVAIVEIGMNHPGEIEPLARMARPHVALITTVAPVHLAAFGSVRDIAREKATIFRGLEPGGTAVINADLPDSDLLRATAVAAAAKVLTFGAGANADYRLARLDVSTSATMVRAARGGAEFLFRLNVPARHLGMNALGVLAAVDALGLDLARATLGLLDWQAPVGRGAAYEIALGPAGMDGYFTLIDESYNANPASVAAAFDRLAGYKGRKQAVLGDMLELGETAPALHHALADLPALSKIDKIHCLGPLMAGLYARLDGAAMGLMTSDSAQMAAAITRRIQPGDVVMVKGSLGMKMALIVDALKNMGQATPLTPTTESL